jgi:phenylpyruvate tautomerase PptA (4-oxalocrotonate tautomerase family)
MPLYEVQYCVPLARSEKDDLAARITKIHKSAFGAPSLFISITFNDISGSDFYAGPDQVSGSLASSDRGRLWA